MKRYFASAILVLSFPTLFFIVALGVRSYRVGDVWTIAANSYTSTDLHARQWQLGTGRGVILFQSRLAKFSLSTPTAKVDLSRRSPAGVHIKLNAQRPEDQVDLGWDQTRWRRLGFTSQRFKSS